MNPALAAEISRLTADEKLQLVQELWDEIAATDDHLSIPDWHRRSLEKADACYRANPNDGSPWPEVLARLRQRL